MGAPSKLIVDDICRAIFDLRAEIVVVGIVKTKASCVMPRGPKASAASPLSHRPHKPPSTRHETAHPPGGP
jgi:hypothetical protein